MTKRIISLFLILALLLVTLCGCGGKDKPMKKYEGNWISDTMDDGYHYVFYIGEDGYLSMQYCENGDTVQWDYSGTVTIEKIDGKKVMCFSLMLSNRSYAGYYTFSGNKKKLELTYYEGEHVFNTAELFNDGKIKIKRNK